LCKKFMKIYQSRAAVETAKCLIAAEAECQKHPVCQDRDACRFSAHLACYLSTGFFLEAATKALTTLSIEGEDGPLPPGGLEVGFSQAEAWFENIIERF
jgi:hypothetical protein